MGIGPLGRAGSAGGTILTTKDGQKIDVQTLSALTRPGEDVGDIKLTSIDATQLANGQVIHIPAAQPQQQTIQPITITGNKLKGPQSIRFISLNFRLRYSSNDLFLHCPHSLLIDR